MTARGVSDRSAYLGATDVAAVLGLSPYRAPIQVWNEKRGTGPPQTETLRMRLGQLLESAVADAYAETTGRKLRRVGFIAHPVYPFLGGHPDRLVVGERGVVEVKTSATTLGYDDGDVPPHVRVQAVWYLGLTRRDWCDVVLLARQDLTVVRVPADAGLYDDMVEAAVEWYIAHIVDGQEPGPDASDAYRQHLAGQYPADSGGEVVATPDQTLLADELRQARLEKKEAEQRETLVANLLMKAMGEASVMVGPGFRLTWKQRPGRVAWKDLAGDYRRLLEANEVDIDLPFKELSPDGDDGVEFAGLTAWLEWVTSMHTGPPARPFIPYFNDVEEPTNDR